jgi:hypothetical protein
MPIYSTSARLEWMPLQRAQLLCASMLHVKSCCTQVALVRRHASTKRARIMQVLKGMNALCMRIGWYLQMCRWSKALVGM